MIDANVIPLRMLECKTDEFNKKKVVALVICNAAYGVTHDPIPKHAKQRLHEGIGRPADMLKSIHSNPVPR